MAIASGNTGILHGKEIPSDGALREPSSHRTEPSHRAEPLHRAEPSRLPCWARSTLGEPSRAVVVFPISPRRAVEVRFLKEKGHGRVVPTEGARGQLWLFLPLPRRASWALRPYGCSHLSFGHNLVIRRQSC